MSETKKRPLLPLRDAVVFPYANVTFKVGRNFSKKAIEKALLNDHKELVVVAQKNAAVETPGYDDIYNVGTVCTVLQVVEGPGGVFHVFLEGEHRVRIENFQWIDGTYIESEVVPFEADIKKQKDLKKLRAILESALIEYVQTRDFPQEFINETLSIEDNERFVDFIVVGFISLKVDEYQRLLSAINLEKRFQQVISIIKIELELRKIEEKIDKNVKKKLENGQREYFLNEQINALKNELHSGNSGNSNNPESKEDELSVRIHRLDAPGYVKNKLTEEYDRLQMLPPMSSESGVVRT